MIFASKILKFLRPLIAAKADGFAVFGKLDPDQERPDRFVAISIEEIRDELPGANTGLYRATLSVAIGTRHTGDGRDPGGEARESALEAIDDLLGNWTTARAIDSTTDLVGIKREALLAEQSDGSHTVAAVNYELMIMQEV